jgi:hypothetical protein
MANLTFPKSALEPRANLPTGMIQVIFNGFKPKLSKNKEKPSVNMNPELKVINDSRNDASGKPLNGQRVFENLNLSFLPRVQDFCHAFGLVMTEDGDDVQLPGYFDGDTASPDPANWGQYHGPLQGEIATLELCETQAQKKDAGGNYVLDPTKTRTEIKRYICRVPNCQVQHMESLIQS